MSPEEEAYEEALRRIREAEKTGAVELDLSELELDRLPPELERLSSLQSSVPENLCVGHNQRLKMEVTKKEERGESKEVKQPEIESAIIEELMKGASIES